MSRRRSVLPSRGNPMRAVVIFLVAGFGAMLVGFPVLTLAVGLGVGWALTMALMIAAVATFILWIVRAMANVYETELELLNAGRVVASWQLSPDEHRSFLASERRGNLRYAALTAIFGVTLGLLLGYAEDWLLGGIMVGGFLIATVVILTAAGPPRNADSDEAREVLIGERGVRVLGRYVPFHAPLTRLRAMNLEHGDPSVLIMHVRSGNRSTGQRFHQLRVPVPHDRLAEAEALVGNYHLTRSPENANEQERPTRST